MKRIVFITFAWLVFASVAAQADMYLYEVTGFPLARGVSVPESFWAPHDSILQDIADMLQVDSTAYLQLIGWADATEAHPKPIGDALNAGYGSSRNHAVENRLVEKFGVPRSRFLTAKTGEESRMIGPQYRKVEIRLVTLEEWATQQQLSQVQEQVDSLRERPPQTIIQQFTRVFNCFSVGAGVSTTPFGHPVFVLRGSTGTKRIGFEAELGHSLYKRTAFARYEDLSVNYRKTAGRLLITLKCQPHIILLVGWQRSEEYAIKYGRYISKFEGPEAGLRLRVVRFGRLCVAASAVWTPGEEDIYGRDVVRWKNDVGLIEFTASFNFGGAK